MIVGIDFGTTNTRVSLWKDSIPQAFRYGKLGSEQAYIPSAVTYLDEEYIIGHDAIHDYIEEDESILHRFFKMRLPLNNGKEHPSAEQLIEHFLSRLLLNNEFSLVQQQKQTITQLVVSIPELWHKEVVNKGAERLEQLLSKKLKLPLVQLLSEPTAAVAYLVWKLKQENKGEITQQNILICDAGGGTFDVSLVKVNSDRIEIEAFDGSGKDGLGKSGVFHAITLLRLVYKRQGKKCNEQSRLFKQQLLELERKLQSARSKERIQKAFERPGSYAERSVLKVEKGGGISLQLSDFQQAFAEVQQSMYQVLDSIQESMQTRKLSFDKLFIVGGFSDYFKVKEAILNYFNLNEQSEKCTFLNYNDNVYATAHGCALVAAGQVEINTYYPHEVSIIAPTMSGKSQKFTIISPEKRIKNNEIIFLGMTARITTTKFDLNGVVKPMGKGKEIAFNRSIELPVDTNAEYRIGFKVNSSNLLKFVAENLKIKQVLEYNIGELIPSGLIIMET